MERFTHSIKENIVEKKKYFLELEDDRSYKHWSNKGKPNVPDYEMFFEINKLNSFNFCRINDLKNIKVQFSEI